MRSTASSASRASGTRPRFVCAMMPVALIDGHELVQRDAVELRDDLRNQRLVARRLRESARAVEHSLHRAFDRFASERRFVRVRPRAARAPGASPAGAGERLGDVLAEHRRMIVFSGTYPTMRSTGWPPLKRMRHGIPETWYCPARAGLSSVLSFTNFALPALRGGDFLDDRSEHFARAAPGRPKIHQHRLGALQHLALEVGLGNVG